MSIIIKRNTGKLGVASKIQVKLNGKKVGSVMEKNQIEVEVPEGKSNLEVTRFGNKSNKIAVKSGDIIEITSTPFYQKSDRLILPLSFTIGLIITLIQNFIYRLIIFVSFLLIIAIFQWVFKLFNIKVVTDKTSENL